ncbi:MAG: hypothetical protein GTO45_35920 [Candidatus Aminicenantes bacterium]|nr:hypothetical protein [Candidatus Aminicenantes bacterium]NIM84077.1 hypothetical protein [Candidatus Aminicenantes bacterium]NIN23540.1 hypothetical protein [Candidatus Aminicenantes bacterium]NIN47245.1 hypothetical protein [Candidatus Aminicenantes bacterium]NIN90172.1 hypothetical protein [Candidatus Aminicenantes bacterium]
MSTKTGLFVYRVCLVLIGVLVVSLSSTHILAASSYYGLKTGFPASDLSWVQNWKGLSVKRTSPTSFEVRHTLYHGSTGALTQDHIFEIHFYGMCPETLGARIGGQVNYYQPQPHHN